MATDLAAHIADLEDELLEAEDELDQILESDEDDDGDWRNDVSWARACIEDLQDKIKQAREQLADAE